MILLLNTGTIRWKIVRALSFLALALMAMNVTAVMAVNLKIGYVNSAKVIEQAPQAKAALTRLDKEFSPRDKKLVGSREKIKNLETELEKNSLVLKDSERRSKERQLLILKRDVRRATQEFREDYNLRRNEELAALQKLVFKTITNIAKKQKFDLILHEGAIYASDKIDITDRVLENLRSKFKRGR
jgi:outer membrane protein